MVVGVESVRRELLDVGLREAAGLGLPEALGEVQQGLKVPQETQKRLDVGKG